MVRKREKSHEINMYSGAILPKLLQFTLPLIGSGILQLMFNAADIIVVGRWAGDNSLAAVGSNTAIINLLVNLFVGLSVGANLLAARLYGADEKEKLRQLVHTAMLLSLIAGFILTVAGVCGAHAILVWMRSPAEICGLAAVYLRIYFLGMPATMLYNFGSALLRAVGDTRRPLGYLSVSGVINVAFNLFFVIVCRLDVVGVAVATVISQFISAALVVRCMILDPGAVHLDLRQLRVCYIQLKHILQIGLPAGFQGILFSLSNIVIQASINSFGEIVVAGNAAASNIENFVFVSLNAFYQANLAFTSQNLGAERYDRICPVLLWTQGCAVTLGLTLGRLVTCLGPQLLSIYSDSFAVISAGMDRLEIVCSTYALYGIMEVMVGSLRGLGYSVLPMLVSLIGVCLLRLIWVFTVFQIPAFHTVQTVYWSYPLSWSLTFLAHLLCFVWAIRRLNHARTG